jgi:hypothetical protein
MRFVVAAAVAHYLYTTNIPNLSPPILPSSLHILRPPCRYDYAAPSSQWQACGAPSRSSSPTRLARSAATSSRPLSFRLASRTTTRSATSVSRAPSSEPASSLPFAPKGRAHGVFSSLFHLGSRTFLVLACPSAFSPMPPISIVPSRLSSSTCPLTT